MAVKSSGVKITSLLIVLFFSACSRSVETTQTDIKYESKAAAIAVTPTPFLGKPAIIRGEYQPMKIAADLKGSVDQQETPKIWLEFEKENAELQKVELNDDFKEKLIVAGKLLLNYQYVIHNSENPDERYDASYNQLKNAVWTRNDFREMEINSPDGKRKLTEEEVDQIFSKQAGLINDRYFEIDDHFKPKSAFYNFKKSVNEKLGYSVF